MKVPLGPVTRARAKKMKEALQLLVQAQVERPRPIEGRVYDDERQVTLIEALLDKRDLV